VSEGEVGKETVTGSEVGADNHINTGDYNVLAGDKEKKWKTVRTSGNDVLVLEENTLGSSGRAGSVHDTAKVLRLGRNRVDHVLLTLLGELVEAEDGKVRVSLLELLEVLLLNFHLAVVDNELDVLGLLERVDELGKEMRVEENELGVGLLERVHQTLFAESVVGGDDGHRLCGGG